MPGVHAAAGRTIRLSRQCHAAAFAGWLVEVAQDAADAAKEGGFMGVGAEQVSEGEQRMLDRLRSTLGVEGA